MIHTLQLDSAELALVKSLLDREALRLNNGNSSLEQRNWVAGMRFRIEQKVEAMKA